MPENIEGGLFNLKPQPTHCGLCFQPLPPGRGELLGGLTLCPACLTEPPEARLAFRGFRFQSKLIDLSDRRSLGNAFLVGEGMPTGAGFGDVVLALVGSHSRSLPIEVSFARQADGGGLKSLFRREPKVGDPLFDDTIFVDAPRSAALDALLSSPGLQSIVMELVAETEDVLMKGNACRIQARLGGETGTPAGAQQVARLTRAVAVALHYLDLFCQHLERPAEVPWPPPEA